MHRSAWQPEMAQPLRTTRPASSTVQLSAPAGRLQSAALHRHATFLESMPDDSPHDKAGLLGFM